MKNKRYGLCLSGGGARGAAHIGVLKVLDKYLNITELCGVSAGAIVATSYAANKLKKLERRVNKLTEEDTKQLFKFSKSPYGLFSSEVIEDFVRGIVGNIKLQDLNKPAIVAASDIKHGRLVFFKRGSVAKVVAASSAIPGIFTPVKIGNMLLLDGGLYNNLPYYALEKKVDEIIPIDVGTSAEIAHIKSKLRKTTKAIASLKQDLNMLKSEFRIIKGSAPINKIRETKSIIKMIETIKKGKDNKTLKLIYQSVLSFMSEFLANQITSSNKNNIIFVRPEINHLDFANSKKAIPYGERAAKKFLIEQGILKSK